MIELFVLFFFAGAIHMEAFSLSPSRAAKYAGLAVPRLAPLLKDSKEENALITVPSRTDHTVEIGQAPFIIPEHIISETDLFCNRELNMRSLEAVGFDMDFTLAQYTKEFDLLAYDGAKTKLHKWLGYPPEVLDFLYEYDITRRGCVIDKKRGNVLKLDQHRYLRKVEHGLTPLSKSERKSIYRASYQETETFLGKDFANIDTPFSLVDGCLFAQLVDLKDRLGDSHSLMKSKSYLDLWTDMRRCVDRCHKDGVIKLTVAQEPSKYIIYDEKLFSMLDAFKKSGRKVFLLTNSLWDYTQVVMNYLHSKKVGEDKNLEWTSYFDLIIVGGNKPTFLDADSRLPLYKVQPQSGALENCDLLPSRPEQVDNFLATQGKIFQGGNAPILHTLLQLPSGDNLLYVGDHVFADVLRSKKGLGWRTCLIVPELFSEIKVFKDTQSLRVELMGLKRQQYLMDKQIDVMYARKSLLATTRNKNEDEEEELKDLNQKWVAKLAEAQELRDHIRSKLQEYNNAFHPRWGQLFKAGFQESRISKQIKDYACIYTSKASNLGSISTERTLRPVVDRMAHDHYVAGL